MLFLLFHVPIPFSFSFITVHGYLGLYNVLYLISFCNEHINCCRWQKGFYCFNKKLNIAKTSDRDFVWWVWNSKLSGKCDSPQHFSRTPLCTWSFSNHVSWMSEIIGTNLHFSQKTENDLVVSGKVPEERLFKYLTSKKILNTANNSKIHTNKTTLSSFLRSRYRLISYCHI